ncbi:MAG: hypothetical protein M1832_005946 [Thelocarpon impressellum]|nr:MAG: hypothetical protein M1832_005946 [Thelocarpon impressellum]
MSADRDSSNPFRRRAARSSTGGSDGAPGGERGDGASALTGGDAPTPQPERVQSKRVRIVSPQPSLPGSDGAATTPLSNHDPTGSSSPSVEEEPLSAEPSPIDPFASESGDDDRSSTDEDLRRNTESNQSIPRPEERASGAPPNPFRKALAPTAGKEQKRHSFTPASDRLKPEFAGVKAAQATGRASLDVDAFKRLIMTGNVAPLSSGHPTTPPAQLHPHLAPAGDGGSSTDASSISRQSISEPVAGPQMDTPRTSHDSTISEDERRQLMGGAKPASKQKPPPPRARSLPHRSSKTPPGSPTAEQQPRILTSAAPESPKDLNKPLPPPPISTSPQSGVEEPVPEGGPDTPTGTSRSRKVPPAPPVARRHSQRGAARPTRTDSTRLSPQPEVVESSDRDSISMVDACTGSGRPPPPRPPNRRSMQRPSPSASETSTLPNRPPSDHESEGPAFAASPSLAPARPTSSSSRHSSRGTPSGLEAASPSPSLMAPPLPPPRRHRGSSRGSTETSTPAGGRGSLDEWTPDAPPATGDASSGGAKDVLADLSALQREVDELRVRYARSSAAE